MNSSISHSTYRKIPEQGELFKRPSESHFFKKHRINTSEKVQNILGDICPNCESENYDGACLDCGLGQGDIFWNQITREAQEKTINRLLQAESRRAQKFTLSVDGARVDYFHLAENIGENEATFTIRFQGKDWCFSVIFERKKYRDFNDNNEYSRATNIKLKQPANFDGQHFVQYAKSGRGEYFDFKLAETIAQDILNDPRFI
ncbi:MAG: hypothetical protein ACTTH6_02485 [Candidatus Altimarinota bacterium]